MLHREVVALVVLSLVGVLAFVATRALAVSNAALRKADAVAWHQEGRRALERGNTARALISLSRAAHIARDSRDVAVSLAMALRAAGQDDQAAAVLETLRASHPDDAEVNLQLARIEADRHLLPGAIRYYQDALDALWSPAMSEQSRQVRREFIALLLRQGQRARAVSQALVYAAEAPAAAASQLDAARLLLSVGDARRALDRFVTVLGEDPRSQDALAGAGEAAFSLGDYAAARRYLSRPATLEPRLASLRRVADLTLTADPLAPRLTRAERERRVQALREHAAERLAACGGDLTLQGELDALARPTPPPSRRAPDSESGGDRFENAVDLAQRVERGTAGCRVPPDDVSRAIGIIADARGLAEVR